jgi:prolyl-tRNA synthetase
MRWSRYYLYTTREVPADAEVVSHQLMVRAGMIRKQAAGIYTYLPFGWRSLRKLMAIVRRELDATGAVELSMPAVQPAELWQESGRWQQYGRELLRIEDRHDREFCFAPTAEEVVTDIVRHDVSSYRQLPLNLYQIQEKFRDEIRPRFGLMRGREFLMKDGYSFHADAGSLDEVYEAMRAAYCRIFEACDLEYSVVEADTGNIGGSSSHEFMVLADTGESAVVRCAACGYAANTEKAEIGALEAAPSAEVPAERRRVDTPGAKSVAEVASMLAVDPRRVVKTLLYDTEEALVAALVRGDREVNEVALKNFLGVEHLTLAGEEKVRRATGAPVGFAGPVGLPQDVEIVADESVRGLTGFVCGANEADAHFVGCAWDRDATVSRWGRFVLAAEGDACPRCGAALTELRGIEVGHIFKLGTKYSSTMKCEFLDAEGSSHPMPMGCYGLGIGRTVAAAIEQNHDDDGIAWPLPLAPFQVLLVALNPDQEEVGRAAETLYEELEEAGIEVLYDDRDERPGVKFKDADLIGVPIRIVVGARSLAAGTIELSRRRDKERHQVAPGEVLGMVREWLGG